MFLAKILMALLAVMLVAVDTFSMGFLDSASGAVDKLGGMGDRIFGLFEKAQKKKSDVEQRSKTQQVQQKSQELTNERQLMLQKQQLEEQKLQLQQQFGQLQQKQIALPQVGQQKTVVTPSQSPVVQQQPGAVVSAVGAGNSSGQIVAPKGVVQQKAVPIPSGQPRRTITVR